SSISAGDQLFLQDQTTHQMYQNLRWQIPPEPSSSPVSGLPSPSVMFEFFEDLDKHDGLLSGSPAPKVKGPRTITAERRREIIAYWEKNKDKSMTELSEGLNVPRTTLCGIIGPRKARQ
ncbi:hypothetical protein BGZ65_000752, partial [Modicella reniformis]